MLVGTGAHASEALIIALRTARMQANAAKQTRSRPRRPVNPRAGHGVRPASPLSAA
jgi:hypothetical protein